MITMNKIVFSIYFIGGCYSLVLPRRQALLIILLLTDTLDIRAISLITCLLTPNLTV